jgi:hypothetical protein
MAIRGNLRTMQLSELLQWLSMGQKTGTLVVRGGPGEKRITFQDGRIISSSSTLEREYLGHFLVAYGYITEEELTRAMEVQEESKILLGKILVMIGAIQEDDLADLIRLKAAETIYDIFLWTEGAFEFHDGEVPKLPMVSISMDVTGIVMEGLRRFDEWGRIRTKIRSTREIPSITALLDPSALPERERLILNAVDGHRAIDEIALATHNPEFFVAKFLYELLENGQATIVGERVPEPATAELVPEDPYESVFADAASPFADGPSSGPFSSPRIELEPPKSPVQQDFSRYLRRSGDASVDSSRRLHMPGAAPIDRSGSQPAVPAPAPAAPSSPAAPALARSGDDSVPGAPAPGDASSPIIAANAIPTLMKPMDELMSWSFTPNEAFIISRINGMWDVRSIVKISPFSEREVLRVFQKLHEGGVIAWR